jgi:hypothetical protein
VQCASEWLGCREKRSSSHWNFSLRATATGCDSPSPFLHLSLSLFAMFTVHLSVGAYSASVCFHPLNPSFSTRTSNAVRRHARRYARTHARTHANIEEQKHVCRHVQADKVRLCTHTSHPCTWLSFGIHHMRLYGEDAFIWPLCR